MADRSRSAGRTMVIGFVLVGAAVAAAGCRASAGSASAHPVNGGQAVSIEALDNRFSVHIVDVAAGQPVTVTVHNGGVQAHTFSTGDPVADVVVPRGATRKVTFMPTSSTYFFCRYHEANGMKGALCVRGQSCTGQAFP